jgi:ABC-type cobalamin/Fe3+-siderophores transport system ATPase subunit
VTVEHPSANVPVLEAHAVGVRVGERQLLAPLSFALGAGSVLAILGPSGAGKSTLLAALLGLVPRSGSVRIDGTELDVLPAEERARRIAYVPQNTELRASLRVCEVVLQGRYATALRGGSKDKDVVERSLELACASHLAERTFRTLSGGEQRRVLVARALATGAHALLLDEPTSGLDVQHALEIHGLIEALANDGTVVLVAEHSLEGARRVATRALLLRAGQVVADGPPQEVISPRWVSEVFGVRLVEGGGLGFELERRVVE